MHRTSRKTALPSGGRAASVRTTTCAPRAGATPDGRCPPFFSTRSVPVAVAYSDGAVTTSLGGVEGDERGDDEHRDPPRGVLRGHRRRGWRRVTEDTRHHAIAQRESIAEAREVRRRLGDAHEAEEDELRRLVALGEERRRVCDAARRERREDAAGDHRDATVLDLRLAHKVQRRWARDGARAKSARRGCEGREIWGEEEDECHWCVPKRDTGRQKTDGVHPPRARSPSTDSAALELALREFDGAPPCDAVDHVRVLLDDLLHRAQPPAHPRVEDLRGPGLRMHTVSRVHRPPLGRRGTRRVLSPLNCVAMTPPPSPRFP